MKTFFQLKEELNERISGSGTDRKAVLKKAFRAGKNSAANSWAGRDNPHRTDREIPAPKGMTNKDDPWGAKHKDKGIQKAYRSGKQTDMGYGKGKFSGSAQSKPQDDLRTSRKDKGKNYRRKRDFTGPAGALPK